MTLQESRDYVKNLPKGKRIDFKNLPNEYLVELLTKVRNSLIGCEDAQDSVLWISDLLNVEQDVDADNEYD